MASFNTQFFGFYNKHRALFLSLILFLMLFSCSNKEEVVSPDIAKTHGTGHGLADEFEKENIRQHYNDNGLVDYTKNSSSILDSLPTYVDLNTLLADIPILNQGQWPTCQSNTTAEALYIAFKNNSLSNIYLPSVKYNFYNTRAEYCQCDAPTAISGTWVKNVYEAINDKTSYGFMYGVPSEINYPCGVLDNTANNQTSDYWNTMTEFENGSWDYPNLNVNYRMIALYATPDQVKTQIYNGNLVIFSMLVGDQFYNTSGSLYTTGKLDLPYTSWYADDAHVMVIVGYDDNGYGELYGVDSNNIPIGVFKIRNSWGSDWGDNGFMYLPYTFLTIYPPDSDSNPNPGTSPLNDAENFIYISSITI